MKFHTALASGLSLAALAAQIAAAETVWLDQLDLRAATQGWGDPHRNRSVEGHLLTIGGKTFDRGFGTHAESFLHVTLDGGGAKIHRQRGRGR